MKKICVLIFCLVLVFSITSCKNNKNAPEFWEAETQSVTQGDYDELTEEYYSYVKSVQSQFEKQNSVELQYKYIVPLDENAKKFKVFFEVKATRMEFYIDCTRNTINKTNYQKAIIEKDNLTKMKKTFLNGKHIHKDLDYNVNNLSEVFDFDFEIFTNDMEIPEDYIYNPSYEKILRITMEPARLNNYSCNDAFFNKMKSTLGSYASVELKDYNNLEIQTTVKNCGFIRLKRIDGQNVVDYSTYSVIN